MDFFEHLELAPKEVQNIVDSFSDETGYDMCLNMYNKLAVVGWTCGGGLDGVPHSLQPLGYPSQDEAEAALRLNQALGSVYTGGSRIVRSVLDRMILQQQPLFEYFFGDGSPWIVINVKDKFIVKRCQIKAKKLGLNP